LVTFGNKEKTVSRIGKKPVNIPSGVQVTLQDNEVVIKGPKGQLTWGYPADITVAIDGSTINVSRPSDNKSHRALHGLTRVLISNMIQGVTEGFQRELEVSGVGYAVEMRGRSLFVNVGYSHPILVTPPEGITIEVPKPLNVIVRGIDKQLVGQVAAKIRSIKPVEPYKGKGIRYRDEMVRRKAGKKVGSK